MCSQSQHSSYSNEPNQALGLLLCLLVGAYIYYYLATTSQPQREQTRDPLNDLILENAVSTDNLTPETPSQVDDLRKAFEAGTKTYMQFDLLDMRRMKHEMERLDQQSREREKRMEMLVKTWREEQLGRIWADKQRGERGFGRWLRLGSSRVMGTEVVRNEVLKRDVEVSAVKEVQFNDEKRDE